MSFRMRTGLIASVLCALSLVVLIHIFVRIYPNWLWFEELGYLPVYRTRLLVQVSAFLAGFLMAATVLAVNWLIPFRYLSRGLSRATALGITLRALKYIAALAALGFVLVLFSIGWIFWSFSMPFHSD